MISKEHIATYIKPNEKYKNADKEKRELVLDLLHDILNDWHLQFCIYNEYQNKCRMDETREYLALHYPRLELTEDDIKFISNEYQENMDYNQTWKDDLESAISYYLEEKGV